MFHLDYSRMITQMAVLAVAPSWKLPPQQRIPPSSLPREAPSSPREVRLIPPASLTTQTAKVKRTWQGATTTPLQVLYHLKSKHNLQEDPLRVVSFYDLQVLRDRKRTFLSQFPQKRLLKILKSLTFTSSIFTLFLVNLSIHYVLHITGNYCFVLLGCARKMSDF